MSTGKKRPNISFDTMFVWFGMKFEAVICQKPLWAESSPPRSLEGTKKPGLLRVKLEDATCLGDSFQNFCAFVTHTMQCQKAEKF